MTEEKTNVMRLLDQKKISYTPHWYDTRDGALDALTAAERVGIPPETCFKTLVTVGASKKNHVFVVPAGRELDLKAAAKAAERLRAALAAGETIAVYGDYDVDGITATTLLTHFLRGEGATVIDETASALDQMTVSAGKVGCQVTLSPADLCAFVGAVFAPVSK